jgi:HEAT repeat protein
MASFAALLLVVLVVAGCDDRGTPPAADPYRVVVDVGPLIRAFGEDTASADEAAEQIAALGVPAIPALAAALEREPRDVRLKAVEVLATIDAPEAVPPLLAAARDDADVDVRADSLRALGSIGDPRARGLLEERLADPDLTVRVGAVMGCAPLCTSEAAIGRLTGIALDPAQPAVALAAQATLGRLRAQGGEVAAAVERARTAPRELASPDVRALAALLAADVDAAQAAASLVAALPAASPRLQRQLLWRLGEQADASVVPAVAALLASDDPNVRLYAADGLAKLAGRGVAPAAAALAAYAGQKPPGTLPPPEF